MSNTIASSLSARRNKVVKFPAVMKSRQKPLEWWAEGGLVYCNNPNKPDKKPSSLFPTEALQQVRSVVITLLKDMKQYPNDYHVTVSVLKDFFDRFVREVHDEALRQDEEADDSVRRICNQYGEAVKVRNIERAARQKEIAKGEIKKGVKRITFQ
jgi:hypothetical protein